MAVHTWINGEAITASKLNKLEKKKAYVEGTLDFTTCTAREMLELMEDMPYGIQSSTEEGYRFRDIKTLIIYYASTLDDYLEKLEIIDSGGGVIVE